MNTSLLRKLLRAKRCRIRLRMSNIHGSAARPGTRMAPEFFTHGFPKGERPDAYLNFYQQIYFHKLATPDAEDKISIGRDFPRSRNHPRCIPDGKYILATVATDGGDFAHICSAR